MGSGTSAVSHLFLLHPFCPLNTDFQAVSGIKYIDFDRYDFNTMSVDDCIKDILDKIPRTMSHVYMCSFILGSSYRFIAQSNPSGLHASGILFSYATTGIIVYRKSGGYTIKYETNWTETKI